MSRFALLSATGSALALPMSPAKPPRRPRARKTRPVRRARVGRPLRSPEIAPANWCDRQRSCAANGPRCRLGARPPRAGRGPLTRTGGHQGSRRADANPRLTSFASGQQPGRSVPPCHAFPDASEHAERSHATRRARPARSRVARAKRSAAASARRKTSRRHAAPEARLRSRGAHPLRSAAARGLRTPAQRRRHSRSAPERHGARVYLT